MEGFRDNIVVPLTGFRPFNSQLKDQLSALTSSTGQDVTLEVVTPVVRHTPVRRPPYTPPSPQKQQAQQVQRSTDYSTSSEPAPETGTFRVKLGNGEAVLQLTSEQQDLIFSSAVTYQKQLINEKRASAWATFAMAAISGLSAVAIGVTLAQGVRGKKNTNILNV
jgi:hypothetical protein